MKKKIRNSEFLKFDFGDDKKKFSRKGFVPKVKDKGTPDSIRVNSREITKTENGFRVEIKAISINDAYRGQRFKTPYYEKYEQVLLWELLPKFDMPPPPFKVLYICGLSSKGGDIGNIEKPLNDILQKKYGFNDNLIYDLRLIKKIVKKGEEFIDLSFKTYDENAKVDF